MSDEETLSERFVQLELLATHLQHDYEQLNEVVVLQNSTIENLARRLDRFERRVAELESGEGDMPIEKPPHY